MENGFLFLTSLEPLIKNYAVNSWEKDVTTIFLNCQRFRDQLPICQLKVMFNWIQMKHIY